MSKFHLAWKIISRIAVWGLARGGALAAIYGPLSLVLITVLGVLGLGLDAPDMTPGDMEMLPAWLCLVVLVAAVEGGLTGLLVGLVDGLVLGIITVRMLSLRGSIPRSHKNLNLISAAIGGLGTFSLFMFNHIPLQIYDASNMQIGVSVTWYVWVVVPTVIAASYGWWIGDRIAVWMNTGATLRAED